METTDYDFFLRHTGYQTSKHVAHYKETGELQLPLFDTEDFDRTWKQGWDETIEEADTLRAQSRGESE